MLRGGGALKIVTSPGVVGLKNVTLIFKIELGMSLLNVYMFKRLLSAVIRLENP